MRAPWKKGESGNPRGFSKKAREKKVLRDRLKEIRQAILKGDTIEDNLAFSVLQDGCNYTSQELVSLMKNDLVPHACKVILQEMSKNPDYALKLIQTLLRATDNKTAQEHAEVVEQQQATTREEVKETLQRLNTIIRDATLPKSKRTR